MPTRLLRKQPVPGPFQSALGRAVRGAGAALAAALVLAGCAEQGPTAPAEGETPPSAVQDPIACRASRETLTVSCGGTSGSAGGGPGHAIFFGQGRNVWLQMSNPVYEAATDELSFEVTLRNLTAQPLGTADGLTPQPLPYGISARPDGTANFTQAGQPYWQYGPAEFGNPCCLKPTATTAPRRWKFHMNGAYSFLFSVGVSTQMPADYGVLQWQQYLHRGLGPSAADTVSDLFIDLDNIFYVPRAIYAFGFTGYVARYSNDAWEKVPLPDGAGRKIVSYAVLRSCPTGQCGWGITNSDYFYQYDDTASERFRPVYVGPGMRAVSGSAPHDSWAVGDSGRIMVTRPSGTSGRGGIDWHRIASPTTENLRAVWVEGTFLWVGGESDYLYRFDGSTWRAFPLPTSATVVDIQGISSFLAPSGRYVWAVAVRNGASGPESFVFAWNGTSWEQALGPVPTEFRAIGVRRLVSPDLDVNTRPEADVYVVGSDRLLHWNGAGWTEQHLDRRGESLFAVAGISNSGWAVGGTNGSVWLGRRREASPFPR
jgi:hypothetical protein